MLAKFLRKFGCLFLILLMIMAVGCSDTSGKSGNNDNKQNIGANTSEPVAGGTLRIVRPSGPIVLGWAPDFGPSDYAHALPGAESLLAVNSERELEGLLAESFEEDPDNLTITFHLRKGVKFHDGSDFNAEVAKWNYEIGGKYSAGDTSFLKSIEVVDDYTLVFHLNEWHNQILPNMGISLMFSKEAFEANGGETNGGIEWARANLVGTGPFILKEYNRDNNMIWVKNENYWGKEAYLDGIEITFVPEASTAMALMQNGDADMWVEGPAQNYAELEALGFVNQKGWAGVQMHLIPNTVDPNSPFQDKRVREALEYAIDKQALCDVLGYGYMRPITAVSPPGDWGGDLVYREYNPEKAKQLLMEAGYEDGLEFTLLAQAGTGGRNETAEALAGLLDKVGFKVKLDLADTGRFFGAAFGGGWDDVILTFSGQDANYLTSFQRWWGHNVGSTLPGIGKPEELIRLSKESILKRTLEEQKEITEQMIDIIGREALVIPLFDAPSSFMRTTRVHTDWLEQGLSRWKTNEVWLEPEN
ncbi:MAG: ABC transporter substrate-binding protein [Firmicutes bacterium]|nr:ABC transporter substrate-binding protein [Bacillota bacterium]